MGSDERTNRIHWLPVPGLAVRVRVTMDAQSELDDLARTILRLIQVRDRRPDELARKLGLENARDLVEVALEDLQDRYLIEPVEEQAEVYKLATDDIDELQGAEVRPGWAFILPGEAPKLLPRLWLDDKPPAAISNAKRQDRDFSEEHQEYFESFCWKKGLNDKSVSTLLQELVRRPDLLLCTGEQRQDGNEETTVGLLEMPVRSGATRANDKVIRSIEIDHVNRQTDDDFTWTTLWMQVDLLPRIAQPATVVYHQPDIQPAKYPTRPISPEMERWLEGNEYLEPLQSHIKGLAESLRKEFSVVLSIAGIDSEAELEAAVDEHRAELEQNTGLKAPVDGEAILQRNLPEKIRDAWRWLYISRQCPDRYVRTARDAYAHVVEALAQALRDHSLDELNRWKRYWKVLGTQAKREFREERKNSGWQADRLGMIGVEPVELKPSLGHLKEAMKDIDSLRGEIKRAKQKGAGISIALWLLPLFLLGDDKAKEYAGPLRDALSCEPLLFEYINKLIDIRNEVFHDRSEDLPLLDEVDREAFKVWAALEEGYCQSSPATSGHRG